MLALWTKSGSQHANAVVAKLVYTCKQCDSAAVSLWDEAGSQDVSAAVAMLKDTCSQRANTVVDYKCIRGASAAVMVITA